MNGALLWLEESVGKVPLPVLEVWGRLAYLIGVCLAVTAFGGFTLRLGQRWGFGRERQAWDAKALWSMPLTFVLVAMSGYFGSFLVLVPGAQTFESLKDLAVFSCIVLFGYPALVTVPFAYGLSDLIEGVPPESLWSWLPGYFINPACFWIAYQLIGKCPDFRRAATWGRYLLFVVLFMSIEPVLWGFVCSDRFTPQISYRHVTSALVLTTSITWLIAPWAMLAAFPLARSLGLFWAEIAGHVKERALGSREWLWVAGTGDSRERGEGASQGLPIRIFILLPFIALVLVMVASTAYATLRSAEDDAEKLALRLHQEISENIQLRLDEYLAERPAAAVEELGSLLRELPIARHGRALLMDRSGATLASSLGDDAILEAAAANLRRVTADLTRLDSAVQFSFAHVTARPLSRETWLAHAAPYRVARGSATWIVVTLMPEAFYLAGVRLGNSRSAMVFAAALVLSLALAAMLASRVTEPLREIARATNAVASGSLTVRVPPNPLAELDMLAGAFNGMAGQLKASFDELVIEVERRKASEREIAASEARLRTSENRIQLAVKAGQLGIWDWDVVRDELIWDDSMYELYGVQRVEFGAAYEAWSRLLAPEDAPVAVAGVQAALRGEKEFESEFRIRRRDGEVRFIRAVALTLRDEAGQPLRMVGINWDVTERRRFEEERGALLHTLGERVKELRLLHAASRLLQRTRPFDEALVRELVQQMPAAWQYPECCEARVAYLELEVTTPGFRDSPQRQSKPFETRDGVGVIEVVYLEDRPAAEEGPFLAEERALLDSLAELLVSYLELRKHQEHLEALVRERTFALERAKEQAEMANRAKSTFLATMSHEIRTPMNAILGFGQLLQRDSDMTPRDRDRLDKLLRNGYHLLEIINNVLEMSKIEAGRSEANSTSLDLHRLVLDVEGMVRERFESKGLSFVVTGVERLPRHVRSDAAKVRQILINLLGNAARFTDSGTVMLSVEFNPVGGQPALTFRVADTGVGIAADELESIFEPFRQTASGVRSQMGTGLGLTISRDFARLLGGDLRVTSGLGRGTTFVLELPVEIVPTPDSSAVSAGGRRVLGLTPGQAAPLVLVVDDERDQRALMCELLGGVGISTLEADDGSTALEMLAQHRPDLIFMDVRMPRMDGIEATRLIRATDIGKGLPIIISSASVFQNDRASVLATGANEFIAKPFREAEIWSAVERHLGPLFTYGPDPQGPRLETSVPTRDQVRALGPQTVDRVREALELGYVSRVASILERVGDEHRQTALALTQLAERLELQTLMKLL